MFAASLPLDARVHGRLWNLLRRIAREPLLHFVVLGIAIFALAHVVEARNQAAETRLELDAGLPDRLANLYRSQYGVSPSAEQLENIVDDFVDDEVLYREALRLGLDQDDEIIRRRLIQKLEFLQRDSVASRDPGVEELRAFHASHPALFSRGARVTFEQEFFNPDRDGEARALDRARDARLQLGGGGKAGDSDSFPLEPGFNSLSRDEAVRRFGDSAFADALFASPVGEWTEPQRSGLGWHVARITSVEPAGVLPFDAVAPDVRAAWLEDAVASQRRAQLDDLRTRYHVSRNGTH
jgi:peptidyl-prolyl cis-trans isomerase C